MIDRTLKILIEEFHDTINRVKTLVPRTARFPDAPNKIKVAIGMRRSGKTYFIYQSILERINQGIPLSRILYLNFEDDRLQPLDIHKLAQILDAFYTLLPENHEHQCFFYLDEIQNIVGFESVVRRFFDTKNIDIYLTGSSAKLLSKEIATTLRGRSISTEIWPYSFNEYITAENISINRSTFGNKTRDQLNQIFQQYLHQGGFPEVIKYSPDIRQQTLQDYVEIVLYRDIVDRYDISNPSVIKYMILSMIHNVAKPFSLNKFYNDLRSQGYKSSKDALYDYASYIEDAYLLFSVPIYAKSIRKVNTNPKKIYAIDTGLITAMTLSYETNLGNLFENLIYLELRRLGCQIYYYLTKDRYEVDFLIQSRQGKKYLIQVAWNLDSPETMERETRALECAKKELGIDGEIITLESYLQHGVKIS